MYLQDTEDCNSTTFQELCVQDTQDFSGTLAQDFSRTFFQDLRGTTTQDYIGTSPQDSCGQDMCDFNSTVEQGYRAQGVTSGYAEMPTVVVLTLSHILSPDPCDLPWQGCNSCRPDSSVSFNCVKGAFGLDMVGLHERVFASGLPNYKGVRIPLEWKLNILQWRSFFRGLS